ncbi:WD40-repeat-containing domain protein [Haematococcus lacustris]
MIGVWEAYGHTERVFDVRFQPSTSDLFASASEDCTVRVWRDVGARRYKQVLCCKSHESEVLRLGWSGDGSMLASGSADRTVRVWKAPEQGQPASYCSAPLACLSGHPEEVYHVEFVSPAPLSPPTPSFPSTPPISSQCHLVRESHLLVASSESLFLWDLDEGLLQQQADAPGTSGSTMPAEAVASGYQHAYIFSCAVQPAGGGGGGGGGGGSHRLVAAGCSDGQLRLWALSQSGLTWVGSCPLGAGRGPALITATLFSADRGQLAVVTRDGSVAVMVGLAGGGEGSGSQGSTSEVYGQ